MGLDGLSIKLLKKYYNFTNLNNKLTFGSLKSIIPPVTIPAWTCLGTGLRPENLGLVDFFNINKKYKRISLDIAKNFGNIHFFFLLNDQVTLNRFPGTVKRFGKMSEQIEIVEERGKPAWKESLPWKKLGTDKENFRKNTDKIKKILSHKSGLIFYFLHLPDGGIHWGSEEDMKEIYQMVGEFLEEMIERCEREGRNLIVVSDHGARKVNRRFNINTWLKEEGYLSLNKRREWSLKLIDWLSERNLNLVRTISSLTDKITGFFGLGDSTGQGMILDDIDWENTQVFGVCTAVTNYIPLYINLEGKYEEGCVSEEEYEDLRNRLKEELLKVKNPETGEKVIEEVWFKEEVYDGEKMDAMPDLVVKSKGNYLIGHRPFPNVFSKRDRYIHDLYGTFMAYGPDFKEGYEVEGAEIVDVAPTILHLMNEKIPKDMEGRVLKEIFREGSDPAERDVKYCEPIQSEEIEESELDEDEQRKIKERLKGLGYME